MEMYVDKSKKKKNQKQTPRLKRLFFILFAFFNIPNVCYLSIGNLISQEVRFYYTICFECVHHSSVYLFVYIYHISANESFFFFLVAV